MGIRGPSLLAVKRSLHEDSLDYPPFMEKIARYFTQLFLKWSDLQDHSRRTNFDDGKLKMNMAVMEMTKVIGESRELMRHNGIDVPLFTSDGPWLDMLENVRSRTSHCQPSTVDQTFRRI